MFSQNLSNIFDHFNVGMKGITLFIKKKRFFVH